MSELEVFADPPVVQDKHQQWGTSCQWHTYASHVSKIFDLVERERILIIYCLIFQIEGWNSCLLEGLVTAEWEATMASLDLTHSRTKRFVFVYLMQPILVPDSIACTWNTMRFNCNISDMKYFIALLRILMYIQNEKRVWNCTDQVWYIYWSK